MKYFWKEKRKISNIKVEKMMLNIENEIRSELKSMVLKIGVKIIDRCAEMYKFDSEEAKRVIFNETNEKWYDGKEEERKGEAIKGIELNEKMQVNNKNGRSRRK